VSISEFRRKALTGIRMVIFSGYPWAAGSDAAARRRRYSRRQLLEKFPRALRGPAALAMILCWPLSSLSEARRVAWYALPGAISGRTRARLALDAWLFAQRHNIPPTEFIAYRLFEPAEYPPDAWLSESESGFLTAGLTGQPTLALARDKHAFSAFCSDHRIAAVPTLARFGGGTAAEPFAGGAPPVGDLVVKPRRGACARGLEVWRSEAGTFRRLTSADGYVVEDGPRLSATAFGAHVAAISEAGDEMLVQPRLRPHPSLLKLSGQGMPAVRIITGMWPDGAVEVVCALFQRPAPGVFASQAGPFGLVDRDSGRIAEPARAQREPVFRIAAADPALSGLVLPDWDGVVRSVTRAHGALPGRAALIGWDVALTDGGPVLLEANTSLSFFYFQMATARPATLGRLGPLIGAWV
jgi:hypothetical protein